MEGQSDSREEVKVKAAGEEEVTLAAANGGDETIASCKEGVRHLANGGSRPTPMGTSVPNAAILVPDQLTIFYGGSVLVFDGIPAEKVREIMLSAASAAAAVKPAEMKKIVPGSPAGNTPALTRSPSLQSATSVLASPWAQHYPIHQGSSLCKLQAELPIARRHSLQRFFEKRRDRLGSKSPYPTSPVANKAETTKSDLSAEVSPDADCFGKSLAPEKDIQPKPCTVYHTANCVVHWCSDDVLYLFLS